MPFPLPLHFYIHLLIPVLPDFSINDSSVFPVSQAKSLESFTTVLYLISQIQSYRKNLVYSIFKYILNLSTHHVYYCHPSLSYLISHVDYWSSLLTGDCFYPCLPAGCPQHSSQREPVKTLPLVSMSLRWKFQALTSPAVNFSVKPSLNILIQMTSSTHSALSVFSP